MPFRKPLAAVALAAAALQPVAASAQAACLTEQEVSAVAIYSVPSLVQGVRLKCGAQLAPGGFLTRRGTDFAARYVALQPRVWPQAKTGLIKVLASRSTQARQNLDMLTDLPDDAVRPLVDALIVQEVSARIAPGNCSRIERAIQVASPIDPEVAGTLLGVVAGIVNPDQLPICAVRGS